VTSTLEQVSPRSARYGLAAALPLALLGLIVAAVLAGVAGIVGLIVGLVITAVAVVVRMRTFAAGIDDAIIHQLGAKPADGPEAAGFRNLAEGLSATAGVPLPELLILDTPSVNLLVVGTDAEHAAMIATSGLLSQLSRVELEGVVARAFVQLRQGDVSPPRWVSDSKPPLRRESSPRCWVTVQVLAIPIATYSSIVRRWCLLAIHPD
jgi:Zn-dependent protease with chaperone function